MRRPVRVKTVLFLLLWILSFELSRLCRHPSIRSLLCPGFSGNEADDSVCTAGLGAIPFQAEIDAATTALYDPDNRNLRDPHRHVDTATIPYVVLHPKALDYARLGDFATVVNLQNGRISGAIVADESAPNLPVGEGSIALAQALGIDSNPRTGGKDENVAYLIYPGSGNRRPRELTEIVVNAKQLFDAWGGLDRLNACMARAEPQ